MISICSLEHSLSLALSLSSEAMLLRFCQDAQVATIGHKSANSCKFQQKWNQTQRTTPIIFNYLQHFYAYVRWKCKVLSSSNVHCIPQWIAGWKNIWGISSAYLWNCLEENILQILHHMDSNKKHPSLCFPDK